MILGRYRLLAQLGAGGDGIAYRAEDTEQDAPVEVRLLGGARADAGRWPAVARRLQLAALLDHPAAVRVRQLALDHDPPFVVLDRAEGPRLGDALRDEVPLGVQRAVALARELAAAVAAAHRLGLAHGRLAPGRLRKPAGRELAIDFTGLDVEPPRPADALDDSCRAPEPAGGEPAPAADVYGLGALLFWLLTGRPLRPSTSVFQTLDTPTLIALPDREVAPPTTLALDRLIRTAVHPDPAERPTAREVLAGLAAVRGPAVETMAATGIYQNADLLPPSGGPVTDTADAGPHGGRLGRFRLLEKIGQGGMGAVYRAEDPADGRVVAVKVLRPELARRPEHLRRFHKEARLLAEVNNPFVTNLLEVNEDQGVHYLVMDLVAGRSLARLLIERGQLEERTAVALLADAARGLAAAHERGIVHRDIKPDNILLEEKDEGGRMKDEGGDEGNASLPASSFILPPSSFRVKLSDFGLARHAVESESLNLTQAGTVLGTPLYMAPEQGAGTDPVGPPADVYALGATLFHMLAGQPPFQADTPLALISMHRGTPPPPLQELNPRLGDAVCQVVAKALAKAPEDRYPDAGALLRDLERLLRGEPTAIGIHPRLPEADPARVLAYDWSWELESAPEQLWPHVSNTERLNRAIGLSAVDFTGQPAEGPGLAGQPGVRRFGRISKAGVTAAWEEHPFEWVEARRMGVLREYRQGPFKWMVSVVELAGKPGGGGTTLTHRLRLEPQGLLGRTLAAIEVGVRTRRALERVYRRIDAVLAGKLGERLLADPFEEPAALTAAQRRRLDALLDRLTGRGVEPAVTERLGDFLAQAPAQEVARIRPLALARRLALDPNEVVAACLHGAREGLLVLLWDILCPVCRIPSEVAETLRHLREHAHCPACNLDFDLDFANSVEMIFRAHPEVRASELATYCVGGPAHSPHVAAQVRLAPGERIELDLHLGEGAYRLRGPQLPFALDFQVRPGAAATRWDLTLGRGPDPDLPRALRPGRQALALTNDFQQELLVRVERTAQRADALTAARASALALFRELFPDEVLSAGRLVSVSTVTLLVADLEQAGDLYRELGDARAFGLIHEFFRQAAERVAAEGGAVIKTIDEAVVAAFPEPVAAVRAALDLPGRLAAHEATKNLSLRAAVHRGPALAATINDQLDYFGSTVKEALRLPRLARGGELLLTQTVAADPQVDSLLRARGFQSEVLQADPADYPGLGPLLRGQSVT